jgi:hypothetical protein
MAEDQEVTSKMFSNPLLNAVIREHRDGRAVTPTPYAIVLANL